MQANTACELIAALNDRNAINIALIELRSPDTEDFEALERLDKQHPVMKMPIHTFDEHEDVLKRLLCAGMLGYLLKACNHSRQYKGLQQVHENNWYHTDAARDALRSGDLRTTLEKERDAGMAPASLNKR